MRKAGQKLQMTHKARVHVCIGKARVGSGDTEARGSSTQVQSELGHGAQWCKGHGLHGLAAHLGLGALQFATSSLPGHHFLFHLLPKPCRLSLQGTHTGPQGQLRPSLLLQQFLWVEGTEGVRWSRRQGRGWRWGTSRVTWASCSWDSALLSSLPSLMALDSASLSAVDTLSSSACGKEVMKPAMVGPVGTSVPNPLYAHGWGARSYSRVQHGVLVLGVPRGEEFLTRVRGNCTAVLKTDPKREPQPCHQQGGVDS